jgi:uncharacterized iron-regulated membrane protein
MSATVTTAKARTSPWYGDRRVWWQVHQWVGFKLSLVLAFILFTGTLAVLSHEIDWLLQPSLRVAPSSVEGEPRWERIAASAAAYPRTKALLSIDEPTASAFAARVMVEFDDSRLGFLHVHPTTGAVQGEGVWWGAQRVLRNMHRHLNLPTKYGVPLVSALALLVLVSVATSFVVYKGWWRGFLKPVRTAKPRTLWGDLHRLMGVWSLWFLLLIAVTSVWYLVESLGGDAPPPPSAAFAVTGDAGEASREVGATLSASLAAVRRVDPQLEIEMIVFPSERSGALVFQGQRSAWLVRPRANAAWVDPLTARVLLRTDAREMGVHQRIGEMADPLHFGTFGGYWTRIPWFLFGLALTFLAVSGCAIYAIRLADRARATVSWHGGWRASWNGMGGWRWVSMAMIVIGLVMLPVAVVYASSVSAPAIANTQIAPVFNAAGR